MRVCPSAAVFSGFSERNRKTSKNLLTNGTKSTILFERSEDSRWGFPINPAEDINIILIVFVPLRLLMQRFSL